MTVEDKYLTVVERMHIDKVLQEIEIERNFVLIDEKAHQSLLIYMQGRKNADPIHYKITDENIKEAIDYMDNKEHILIPFDEYNLIQDKISQGEREPLEPPEYYYDYAANFDPEEDIHYDYDDGLELDI